MSEQGWPSGMPCCRVWCRLEIIVERSLSRLVRKMKKKRKQGTRQWVDVGISNLTHNKATLYSETNHNNTEKWLTACNSLKGSLNILRYDCLFSYYKVSTWHKINDQPSQLEVINEAAFTWDFIYSSNVQSYKTVSQQSHSPHPHKHIRNTYTTDAQSLSAGLEEHWGYR